MILTFSKNFELRTSLNHWVVLTFAVDLMKESPWGCYTMLPEAIRFYMHWKALGTKRNVQKAPVKPSIFSHSHFLVLKAFGGSLILLEWASNCCTHFFRAAKSVIRQYAASCESVNFLSQDIC